MPSAGTRPRVNFVRDHVSLRSMGRPFLQAHSNEKATKSPPTKPQPNPNPYQPPHTTPLQQLLSKLNYTASLPLPHAAFNFKRNHLKDHLEHLDGLVQDLDNVAESDKEAARKEKVAMSLPNQAQDWDSITRTERPELREVRPLMGDIMHLLREHKVAEGTTLLMLHKSRMKERLGPYYNPITLTMPRKSDADILKSLPLELRDIPASSLKVLHRMRMRQVIKRWHTWQTNVQTISYQRGLLTRVVSRVVKRTLLRFFERWETKTQGAKEKRARAFRIRMRLRSLLWQPGLIWAASNGSMRMLRWIKTAPMGVPVPMIVSWRHPRNGRTLLHYASEKGRSKMATFLLGIGVNPRVLDASGHNCMHLASANGHTGIVEILVRIGIDPRVMEEGGAGNVMTLFKHANVMSDLRKVPITNFKLKRPDPGGGKLK